MKPEDPGSQDPHDHEPKEHNPVQYFVPGHVVLHLEHPAGLTQPELASALERFIYNSSQDYLWRSQFAPPKPGSVITFSEKDSQEPAFSIAPLRMTRAEASQDEQVRLLLEIYSQLNESPVRITGEGQPPILLKTVSPNWLIGGVSHQIGLGGPGDWPDPASRSSSDWPEFHLPEALELQAVEAGQGAGVHVAILDTAPCLHDLDEAYDKWHGKGHPLIDSLLDPDGPLHVYPASYADLRLVGDYSLLDHRYLMADHGLFVAGVIHTLARRATLHLYEVLNPYGVGCVETIAKGLLEVLSNPDIQRPLIVNCSLVLDIPREGESYPDFPTQLADPGVLKHMRTPLQEMFDRLTRAGVVAVAAAGNDASRSADSAPGSRAAAGNNAERIAGSAPGSRAAAGNDAGRGAGIITGSRAAAGNDTSGSPGGPSSPSRPPARFPAAFPNVIGVGAVSKEPPVRGNPHQAASYSNLADDQPEDGYVTLGGESGKDQGMLGIFIRDFPNPEDKGQADTHSVRYIQNESGWARWAGTSFATPVISGILAAWWDSSLGPASSAAQTILGRAVTGATDQKEKVIVVEQS